MPFDFSRAAIFPLRSGTKEPLTDNGFKDARIGYPIPPGCNIGFVPASLGLVAIDLDPGHDEAWVRENLPPTLTVKTPRGYHLYYLCDDHFGNGRLQPHIDVRSANGYTVLPPSELANGAAYSWTEDSIDPVKLPADIHTMLRERREAERKPLQDDDGDDNPSNLAKARVLLKNTDPRTDGWQIAVKLRRDVGLSQGAAVDVFTEWSDTLDWPWDHEKIWSVCRNAGKYGTGDQGQYSGAGPDAYGKPDISAVYGEAYKPRRFKGRKPSEGRNLPELIYFDEEKTFPKVPGGASLIVVGPKSSHKTGLVLKKCLDAAEGGAKVLFIAAEGGHGVEKHRLPVAIDSRWEDFDEKWLTVSGGFNIFADADELIAEHKEWSPDVVVMDTLSRVTGGADINAPNIGSAIHHAADRIAAAFDALVVLIHHPKHGGTVSLGSVLIDALAYAVWHVSKVSKDQVKCWVDKMKDGPAEFEVLYRVNLEGAAPVIENDTRAKQAPKRGRSSDVREVVEGILRQVQEPISFDTLLDAVRPFNISEDTLENHVRGKKVEGKIRVHPDLYPLLSPDRDGMIPKRRKDWRFLPLGE